jgi:hypothetical protein
VNYILTGTDHHNGVGGIEISALFPLDGRISLFTRLTVYSAHPTDRPALSRFVALSESFGVEYALTRCDPEYLP